MVSAQTFEEFLSTGAAQIGLGGFLVSLGLAALLSYFLGKVYIRYGTSLSNRRAFARNFVLLATTTTLIISIVKSSLALSLGLVGALSIVRFRSAIKEPEELAYLFLCIAIGLGYGANQILITTAAVPLISLLIIGRSMMHTKEEQENLYLTISGKKISLKEIVKILHAHSSAVHLKRFDQTHGLETEATFIVDFNSFEDLEKTQEKLKKLSPSITVTYLDKSGLY